MSRWAAPLAALVIALAGCTVVHIQDTGTGDVQVKQRFGIVSVEVNPGSGMTVVESTSLGLINGFQGLAVGYHSATLAAAAPEQCRLVLWIKTDEQLKELNELLHDRTDVCVVRPEDHLRRKP